MAVSVFDLFSVGIGPSSSHTVGPMRAAGMFVDELVDRDALERVADVRVDLFGSLAATGAGHGTMPAILLGLEGYRPDTIETDVMEQRLTSMRAEGKIRLAHRITVSLNESDIHLHPGRRLGRHPNAMTMAAFSSGGDASTARPTSLSAAASSSPKPSRPRVQRRPQAPASIRLPSCSPSPSVTGCR